MNHGLLDIHKLPYLHSTVRYTQIYINMCCITAQENYYGSQGMKQILAHLVYGTIIIFHLHLINWLWPDDAATYVHGYVPGNLWRVMFDIRS